MKRIFVNLELKMLFVQRSRIILFFMVAMTTTAILTLLSGCIASMPKKKHSQMKHHLPNAFICQLILKNGQVECMRMNSLGKM